SPEKGLDTLLAAWEGANRSIPLKIVGDGPLAELVQAAAKRNPAIEWLGQRPMPEELSILGEARCLLMSSGWYGTFGRTIVEACVKGTAVIVSRMGSMAELVTEGRTGLLFEPGNAEDLAAKVRVMFADDAEAARFRAAARKEYESKYTAGPNYEMLM